MKKLALIGIMVLASLILASSVFATTFVNPPETNAPSWVTNYPYQRNIFWDFDYASKPVLDPGDFLPGAGYPDYAGTDDPALASGDSVWVNTFSDAEWYSSLTIDGVTRNGLIGIDNRTGLSTLTGVIEFHINNHDRDWPIKHLYNEIVFCDNGVLSSVDLTMGLPNGYSVIDAWNSSRIEQDDVYDLQNVWFEIANNPDWETIILTFSVQPGQYALVDSLHIATECIPIPEPGSIMLLGSLAVGLFGAAGIRRKK